MAAPFLETPRFPEDISYDSVGGPRYSTTVVTVKSGTEWRNQNWVYPLHEYEVAKENRSPSVMEDLLHFFHSVGGQYYGFRFKDWMDYTSAAVNTPISYIDQEIGVGDDLETDFQIIKTYSIGAINRVRKITKPIANTVVVSINNVQQTSGWSVDATTGIITFSSPPGTGLSVRCGYEFDVPVRFSSDLFRISLSDLNAFSSDIVLQEIRL